LWSEIYNNTPCSQIVPNGQGIISVKLGDCVSFPSYLDFSQNYYLGLTIGTNSEATPRLKLTSVPYAENVRNVTFDSNVSNAFRMGTSIADYLLFNTSTGNESITFVQNTIIGTPSQQLTIGAILQGATPLVFEGQTVDSNRTTLAISDPTGNRIITLPDNSGTVAVAVNPLGPLTLSSTGVLDCPTCITSLSPLNLDGAYNFGGPVAGRIINVVNTIGNAVEIRTPYDTSNPLSINNGLTIVGDGSGYNTTTSGIAFTKIDNTMSDIPGIIFSSNVNSYWTTDFGTLIYNTQMGNEALQLGLYQGLSNIYATIDLSTSGIDLYASNIGGGGTINLNADDGMAFFANGNMLNILAVNPSNNFASVVIQNNSPSYPYQVLRIGNIWGAIQQNVGMGDPNGLVTAYNGSIYFNTIASNPSDVLWVKTGGFSNTGWVSLAAASIVNIWTDDGTNIYPTNINRNVGIGTNTPQERLHVADGSLLVSGSTPGDDYLYVSPSSNVVQFGDFNYSMFGTYMNLNTLSRNIDFYTGSALSGGNFNIYLGNGTNLAGGNFTVNGGSSNNNTGGSIYLYGGFSSMMNGGEVYLMGGYGNTGGRAIIEGGNGLSTGGNVEIRGGQASINNGGNILIQSGIGSIGGDISISANIGTSISDGVVNIYSGGFLTPGVVNIGNDPVYNAGTSTTLRLMEARMNGVEYVGFKAPDSLSVSTTYTLPLSDGLAGQVLSTNGAGILSWNTVTGTTGQEILQGGNAFGLPVTIGSTDAQSLRLITQNTNRLNITSNGAFTILNDSSSSHFGNVLTIQNTAGSNQNRIRFQGSTHSILFGQSISFPMGIQVFSETTGLELLRIDGNIYNSPIAPYGYQMMIGNSASNEVRLTMARTSNSIRMVSDNTYRWAIYEESPTNDYRITLNSNGHLAIGGNFSGTHRLTVRDISTTNVSRFVGSGGTQCTVVAGTGWSCTSDERLKTNIENLLSASGIISALRPVSFSWKNVDESINYGFIAQEIESIIPGLVTTDEFGFKSFQITGLIPFIVKSQQETISEVNQIKSQINEIRDSLSVLSSSNNQSTNDNNGILNTIENLSNRLTNLENITTSNTGSGIDLSNIINTLNNVQIEIDTIKNQLNNNSNNSSIDASTLSSLLSSITSQISILDLATNKLNVSGELNLTSATIRLPKDTKGTATIQAGQNSINVYFEKPFTTKPIIVATPLGSFTKFYIDNVSQTGFSIFVESISEVNLIFNWIALEN